MTENASLLADINTLRANVMENKNTIEQNEEALENATTKISEITKQLKDRDQKILLLEKTLADYELKIYSTNEQILKTKMEQTMRMEEFEQNTGLIAKLNQEKSILLK
ncbi:unnamed protein product [Onchocerca ochengi]|nr:unnamed protein product [Onchocerca ochengi]